MLVVNEFSRAFINVRFSEKYQRYVSGGYDGEVGNSTVPVPEKIKAAVNRGDFRINDNYPPKADKADGEAVALIAREIEEYSVLAVATGAIDERDRVLVAYRYFWLQKSEDEVDGIGTLLCWWDTQKKPRFHFPEEDPNLPEPHKLDRIPQPTHFDQFRQEVEDIRSQIKGSPFVLEFSRSFTVNGFHHLALYLQAEHNLNVAWAWNVLYLDYPERFTLICCADEKAYHRISTEVERYKKPLQAALNEKESSPTPGLAKFSIEKYNQPNQRFGSAEQHYQTGHLASQSNSNLLSHKIRQCLILIAIDDNVNEQKLLELANYLNTPSNEDWNWEDVLDRTLYNRSYSSAANRYRVLLAILKPREVTKWLDWRIGNNKKYDANSLELQNLLFEVSQYNEKKLTCRRLKEILNLGISELLLKECEENNTVNSSNQQYQEEIEWLLVKSNNLWSSSFRKYARKLAEQLLISGEQNSQDTFYTRVFRTKIEWEKKPSTTKEGLLFSEYRSLAKLFESVNSSLSAMFHQLSSGGVPKTIQPDVEIIPLRWRDRDRDRPDFFLKLPSFLWNKVSIRIGVFTLLAIIAALTLLNVVEFSLSSKSNSRTNQSVLEASLGPDFYLWLVTGSKQAKNRAVASLKSFTKKFGNTAQGYSPTIPEDSFVRSTPDYAFIRDFFTPNIPDLQSPDLKDKPIRSGSPEADIRIVQKILKSLDYDVNITGQFDQKTSTAVSNFRRDKNISAANTVLVDSHTWTALKESHTYMQVWVTADFLLTRLESDTNRDVFLEEDLKNLFDCSSKGYASYRSCVKNYPHLRKR